MILLLDKVQIKGDDDTKIDEVFRKSIAINVNLPKMYIAHVWDKGTF